MLTVAQLSSDLDGGRITSRELVEQALGRISDAAGEGSRAFIKPYSEQARADADYSDRLRKAGVRRSAVDGLPVSLKDLFDVAGDVTRAGSKVLQTNPPAKNDAPAVARLRAAGAVLIGRTNMVEFAFGGVGLNPHYGTPRSPFERKVGHVPGGSSSGAAVSVADGMCVMGLGTDTRGSVRIPAAACGIVGFKPTARRIPREGAFPLSYTLDSIGPLANSVACCAAYDAVLAGEPIRALPQLEVKGLRLLVPTSSPLKDLDDTVAQRFAAALKRLAQGGVQLHEAPIPAFDRQAEYFKHGGFAGAEAYYVHRRMLDRIGEYDPRVGKRIILGKDISAAEYLAFSDLRAAYIAEVGAAAAPFDAIVMPTLPCVPPTIAEASVDDDAYFRWNLRMLRNCGLVNFLDGCAATVPCGEHGAAPVGFMVCGPAGTDRHVLAVAAAIERSISAH